MHVRFVSMALSALLFALGTFPIATSAASALDPCTVVAVEMMDTVNSAQARPGDFFRFQTVNAVTAGARVVIPARTMGYGIVAIASPAGRGGRAGSLVLEPRYLVLPGGTHLGVVLNHHTNALNRTGKSGDAPGLLGAIPVPGVGAAVGIFNYFHNGKNIEVPRGSVFTIFPSDDPSVERCQRHPSY